MVRDLIMAFTGVFKLHPQMAAFVLLLAFCGGSFAVTKFADKSQVQQLAERVGALEVEFKRGNLEQAIRTIQSDIYRVERLIEKGEANERDESWLAELRVGLGQKLRELERLED